MFRKGTGVLIFVEMPFARCPIWLWIYMRKVLLDHLPYFINTESSSFCSLRAIAPPARSEWVPTRSGSSPASCHFKVLMDWRMLRLISSGVIVLSLSPSWYVDISECILPPFVRMWWMRRASARTQLLKPSDVSWWIVCPILPFFWFEIFNVAESASSSLASGDFLFSNLPSLKNPTFITLNCFVRVAWTILPFFTTTLGAVYSPTLSK